MRIAIVGTDVAGNAPLSRRNPITAFEVNCAFPKPTTMGRGPQRPSARRCALTMVAFLQSLISLQPVACKIVAAIHREALRLWRKGARFVS